MADPKTRVPNTVEEYNIRFHANLRYSGFGLDTTIHMPCPFCAEPEWLVYRIIDSEEANANGATCSACGRSAKAVFRHGPSGLAFEIVQSGGDDPPQWHREAIPMRRVQ